jgi:hypothetical protein
MRSRLNALELLKIPGGEWHQADEDRLEGWGSLRCLQHRLKEVEERNREIGEE